MKSKLSKEERIESLKKKQGQIKAKIKDLEASDKSRERKRETRRKILIGAYYYDKAKEEKKMDEIKSIMDIYLKRNYDRALFGLKLLDEKEQQ